MRAHSERLRHFGTGRRTGLNEGKVAHVNPTNPTTPMARKFEKKCWHFEVQAKVGNLALPDLGQSVQFPLSDPIDGETNHLARILQTELFLNVRTVRLDRLDAQVK